MPITPPTIVTFIATPSGSLTPPTDDAFAGTASGALTPPYAPSWTNVASGVLYPPWMVESGDLVDANGMPITDPTGSPFTTV